MTALLLLLLALPARAQDPAVDAALARFLSHENALPPKAPEAEIELGRFLFFDPRFSADRTMSCATCHQPEKGWTDGRARAVGLGGKTLRRHTPSLANARYDFIAYKNFFWDGRAHTPGDAALTAMTNPEEMALPKEKIPERVGEVPEYVKRFKAVYGPSGVSADNAAHALSAFMFSLEEPESRFEAFRHGRGSFTDEEKRGLLVFTGKARCIRCHTSSLFTDGMYHNIGIRSPGDPGRFAVEPLPQNRGAFKTPALLHAAYTPPYMHDGSLKTLREVVDFYDKGGEDDAVRDPMIGKLSLTEGEKGDLIAFLKAISSPLKPFKAPVLPKP